MALRPSLASVSLAPLALLGLLLPGLPWGALVSLRLSVLFAVSLPASDLLFPATWGAETLQGVLDLTSLLGTSYGYMLGLLDTLLARSRLKCERLWAWSPGVA